MHPGPGQPRRRASGEVVDSPQAVITAQVEAGVVVRMAVLYELLAGARDVPAPTAGAVDRMSASRLRRGDRARPGARPARRPARPRRARARPARGHRRAARRPRPRRRDRRARRARQRSRRPTAPRSSTARAATCCPAFVDPHVHLRTPGQEHKEDLETGTRAAAAGGFCAVVAMPNTDPVVDSRAAAALAARRRRARRARRRSASCPRSPAGCAGSELTEMAELRDEGALGFTDDGKPVVSAGMLRKALQYQRLGGGVHRAARGGPVAQRPRRDARGRGQRAARHRRDPERQRVDDGRPRRRARRLRGRPHPHPAPQLRRVGRGGRARPRQRGVRDHAPRPRRTTCCLTDEAIRGSAVPGSSTRA